MSNNKLIIDIETAGMDFDELDEISREQLEKYFKKYAESDAEVSEEKEKLGFWPLTGFIVAIGVLNPETEKGVVFINAEDANLPAEIEKGVSLEAGSETQILKSFWETISKYNYFITFNGRGFDVPYLMVRSAINSVRPSKNLMTNRYLGSQQYGALHVDLADQLNFYGAVRRNFSLHFWATAFVIPSPKGEGITGDDVKELYKNKKYLEIAKYNLGDLKATARLYEKWNQYLNL